MSFDTPWYKFYGNIPTTIDYPKTTMVEEIKRVSIEYPDYPAYDFLGKKVKFKEFYSFHYLLLTIYSSPYYYNIFLYYFTYLLCYYIKLLSPLYIEMYMMYSFELLGNP